MVLPRPARPPRALAKAEAGIPPLSGPGLWRCDAEGGKAGQLDSVNDEVADKRDPPAASRRNRTIIGAAGFDLKRVVDLRVHNWEGKRQTGSDAEGRGRVV
jgi:hypothetical protein